MFKVACLAYVPSDVNYRNKLLPRLEVLRLRRLLIDKCMGIVSRTQIFKTQALFPKRYFDDLVIEDSLM